MWQYVSINFKVYLCILHASDGDAIKMVTMRDVAIALHDRGQSTVFIGSHTSSNSLLGPDMGLGGRHNRLQSSRPPPKEETNTNAVHGAAALEILMMQ
jgi:hypothetical protein